MKLGDNLRIYRDIIFDNVFRYAYENSIPKPMLTTVNTEWVGTIFNVSNIKNDLHYDIREDLKDLNLYDDIIKYCDKYVILPDVFSVNPIPISFKRNQYDIDRRNIVIINNKLFELYDNNKKTFKYNHNGKLYYFYKESEMEGFFNNLVENNNNFINSMYINDYGWASDKIHSSWIEKYKDDKLLKIFINKDNKASEDPADPILGVDQSNPNLAGLCFAYPYIELDYPNISNDSFPDIPGHRSLGWRDMGMRPKWFNMENGRYNIYDPDSIMTTTALVLLKDGTYHAENLYSNPVGKYVERIGKHNIEIKKDPNIKKVFMFIKPYGKTEFVRPDTTYYAALNKNQHAAKYMRKYACRTDRLYEYLLGHNCICVDELIKYGYQYDLDVLKVIQNTFPHIVDLEDEAITVDKFYGYSIKLPDNHPEVEAWTTRINNNKTLLQSIDNKISETNSSRIEPKPATYRTVWKNKMVEIEDVVSNVKEDITESYIPERKINLNVDLTFNISPVLDIQRHELDVKAILHGLKTYNDSTQHAFFDLKSIIDQFVKKCGTATIENGDMTFKIDNHSTDFDVTIPLTNDAIIDKRIKDHANNIFYLSSGITDNIGDNVLDDIWGLAIYAYKGDEQNVITTDITSGYDFYNNLNDKLILDITKVYDLNQIINYFKHTTKIFDNSKHKESTKIVISMYIIPKKEGLGDIPVNALNKWNSIEEAVGTSNPVLPEIITKYKEWNNKIDNGLSNNNPSLTTDTIDELGYNVRKRIKYEPTVVTKTKEIPSERPTRPTNSFPFTSVINISWYNNGVKCTLSYTWNKIYKYGQNTEAAKVLNFKNLLEIFYNNITSAGILTVSDPIFNEFNSNNTVTISGFSDYNSSIKLKLSNASSEILAKYKEDPSMVKEALGVNGTDFESWIKNIWGVAFSETNNSKLKQLYGYVRDFATEEDITNFKNSEIKSAFCINIENNYIFTEFIDYFHTKIGSENNINLNFTLIPKSAIKQNKQVEDKFNLKYYKKLPFSSIKVLTYIKNQYTKYINQLNRYNDWKPNTQRVQYYTEEVEKIFKYTTTYKLKNISKEYKDKEEVTPAIVGNLAEINTRLKALSKQRDEVINKLNEPRPTFISSGNKLDEDKINDLSVFINGFTPIAKENLKNNEIIFILNELQKVIDSIKTANVINDSIISKIIKNKLNILKDVLHVYTLKESIFNIIKTYYIKLNDLINYDYFYMDVRANYKSIPIDYKDAFWILKYQFKVWNPLQKYPALFIGNRLYDQDYKIIKNYDTDILIVDPRNLLKFILSEDKIVTLEKEYIDSYKVDSGVDIGDDGLLKPYIPKSQRYKDPWKDDVWVKNVFKNIFKYNKPRIIFTDYPYNKIQRKDGSIWISKQSGKITRDLYKDTNCCLDVYSDYNWKSKLKGVNFVDGYRSLELEHPYGVQYSAPIEDGYRLGPWYSKYNGINFTGNTRIWIGDQDTYYYNAPDISNMNPVVLPKLDEQLIRDYRYIAFDKQGEECTDRVRLLSRDYIDMNFMKDYTIEGLLPRPSVSLYFPNLDDYMFGYDLNIDKNQISDTNVGFCNDRIMSDEFIVNLFDPVDYWETGVKSFGDLINYNTAYDKTIINSTYDFMDPVDITGINNAIDIIPNIGNKPMFNKYASVIGQIEVLNHSNADYIENFNHKQGTWIRSSNLPADASIHLDQCTDIELEISAPDYTEAILKDSKYLDLEYFLKRYRRNADDLCITYNDNNGFNILFINKYLIPILFKDYVWKFKDLDTFDHILLNEKRESFTKAINSIINFEHTNKGEYNIKSYKHIHYTTDRVSNNDRNIPNLINAIINNTVTGEEFDFIYNNLPFINNINKNAYENYSRYLDEEYKIKLKHIYTLSINPTIFNSLSETIRQRINNLLNNSFININSGNFKEKLKSVSNYQELLDFLLKYAYTNNIDDILPGEYFTESRLFISKTKNMIDNIFKDIKDYI